MSGIKRAKIPRSPFVLEEAEEEETEEEEEEEDDEEEEQEEEEEEGAEEDDSDEDEMEEPHTCEPGQGTPSGPPRTAACNKKLLLDSSAAVARDKPRTSKDNSKCTESNILNHARVILIMQHRPMATAEH